METFLNVSLNGMSTCLVVFVCARFSVSRTKDTESQRGRQNEKKTFNRTEEQQPKEITILICAYHC